jgi:hypothetical protein
MTICQKSKGTVLNTGFPFPDQVEDKFHGNDRGGAGMTKMEVAAPCEPERMWLGIRTYSETQPEGCGYCSGVRF